MKKSKAFYGFRPPPKIPGQIVTNEMFDKLRDEDIYRTSAVKGAGTRHVVVP